MPVDLKLICCLRSLFCFLINNSTSNTRYLFSWLLISRQYCIKAVLRLQIPANDLWVVTYFFKKCCLFPFSEKSNSVKFLCIIKMKPKGGKRPQSKKTDLFKSYHFTRIIKFLSLVLSLKSVCVEECLLGSSGPLKRNCGSWILSCSAYSKLLEVFLSIKSW